MRVQWRRRRCATAANALAGQGSAGDAAGAARAACVMTPTHGVAIQAKFDFSPETLEGVVDHVL